MRSEKEIRLFRDNCYKNAISPGNKLIRNLVLNHVELLDWVLDEYYELNSHSSLRLNFRAKIDSENKTVSYNCPGDLCAIHTDCLIKHEKEINTISTDVCPNFIRRTKFS